MKTRHRFEARKDNHIVYLYAQDIHDAYARFEGDDPKWKHLAWDWFIQPLGTLQDDVTWFLKSAGAKGGKASPCALELPLEGSEHQTITRTAPAPTSGQETTNMSKQPIPKQVSDYMRKIGAAGGKANPAGTAKRKKQAREAAKARWAKWKQQKQEEEK
jgi:hypothetical protein